MNTIRSESAKKSFFITLIFTTLITVVAILPTIIRYSGNLYLVGDYMTQLIPFIKEGRRMFLSGTPFWSCNSFFGSNFLGSYSYYVYGSPFFWPLVLISEKYLCIGITAIFILKHIVAGATSYLFLTTFFLNRNYAVLGAMIYTFSSFTFDSTYYFIFLDVIAFFPLFLYFAEKVISGKSYIGFIFSVFLNAAVNYYCFIGTSIFFLIYLFFRIKFSDNLTWKNARSCIVLYFAGVALSAVILLPAIYTLLDTSKATGSFSKIFISAAACIPQIIKLLRSIVLPSEGILGSGTGFTYSNFCSNAAFLPFFGAALTIITLRNKRKNWITRLLRTLLIITFVPFGNGIFTLFSNLNYTRWWYSLVMIMVLASLNTLQEYENNKDILISDYNKSKKILLKIIVCLTVPLLTVKVVCAYFLSDIFEKKTNTGMMQSIVSSGLTDRFSSNDIRYFFALIIMIAITYIPLHILINKKQIYNFKKVLPVVAVICAISYLFYFSTDSNVFWGKGVTSPHVVDSAQNEKTEYTSRTDFRISLNNYSMIVNQPSINTFNSFKSKATSEFSRIAGFDNHSITKKYFTTEAIQTVLNISAVVDKNKVEYPAKYYCPFGYVYDYYVLDENFSFTKQKKENNERIELMCNACILDRKTAEKLNGIVSVYDGKFDWKKAYIRNKKSSCTDFKMNSSGFYAKTEGNRQRLIYFSIPNDKGWNITVNGEKAEIYTVNGGMIGIVVPKGESTIKASFYPPMMNIGIIISCVALVEVIVFVIINKRRKLF